MELPLHTLELPLITPGIAGIVCTTTLAVIELPVQAPAVGVIVNVTVVAVELELTKVPLGLVVPVTGIVPLIPAGVVLLHEYVLPPTLLDKVIDAEAPLQIFCVDGMAVATGVGLTVKFVELVPVPPEVVTAIVPVVAPAGKVAVICVSLFTVNEAEDVPLKLTTLAPVKPVPVITTLAPLPSQALVGEKLVMEGEGSAALT